jgi:DNA repair photolyase
MNETARGRGVARNPANRFERMEVEPDPEYAASGIRTQYMKDTSRSVISYNDSPDVGFDAGINPYRGCEHGCVYCYARPTHEYLGFSAGLDFESVIMVKDRVASVLRAELMSDRWVPQTVALSGITDAYQPVERRLGQTRACLETLLEFRNPVLIITKNHLVTRDVDILGRMAAFEAAAALISITTLSGELARVMEPRASHPERRLEAIGRLREGGVPVGVMVAPVIPGLTDHEMPAILAAAAGAGAQYARYTMLRLPHGVKELFPEWLKAHYPDRYEKVMGRIRSVRGGVLNDSRFVSRMRGEGIYAEQARRLFEVMCRKNGLAMRLPALSARAFRRPGVAQLSLDLE